MSSPLLFRILEDIWMCFLTVAKIVGMVRGALWQTLARGCANELVLLKMPGKALSPFLNILILLKSLFINVSSIWASLASPYVEMFHAANQNRTQPIFCQICLAGKIWGHFQLQLFFFFSTSTFTFHRKPNPVDFYCTVSVESVCYSSFSQYCLGNIPFSGDNLLISLLHILSFLTFNFIYVLALKFPFCNWDVTLCCLQNTRTKKKNPLNFLCI